MCNTKQCDNCVKLEKENKRLQEIIDKLFCRVLKLESEKTKKE